MKSVLQRLRTHSRRLNAQEVKLLAADTMALLPPRMVTHDFNLQSIIQKSIIVHNLRKTSPVELLERVAEHFAGRHSPILNFESISDAAQRPQMMMEPFPISFAAHVKVMTYVLSEQNELSLPFASLLESVCMILASAGAACDAEVKTTVAEEEKGDLRKLGTRKIIAWKGNEEAQQQEVNDKKEEGSSTGQEHLRRGLDDGDDDECLDRSSAVISSAQTLVDVTEQLVECLSRARIGRCSDTVGDALVKCVALPLLRYLAPFQTEGKGSSNSGCDEEYRRLIEASVTLRISSATAAALLPHVLRVSQLSLEAASPLRLILSRLAFGGFTCELEQVRLRLQEQLCEAAQQVNPPALSVGNGIKVLVEEIDLLLVAARVNTISHPSIQGDQKSRISDLASIVAGGLFPRHVIRYSDFAKLLKQFGVSLIPSQQLSPSAVWNATRAVPVKARRVLAFVSFQIQSRQRLSASLQVEDLWYSVTCLRMSIACPITNSAEVEDLVSVCESFIHLSNRDRLQSSGGGGSLSLLTACANDLLLLLYEYGFPSHHVVWLASIAAVQLSSFFDGEDDVVGLSPEAGSSEAVRCLARVLSKELPSMSSAQRKEVTSRLIQTWNQQLLSDRQQSSGKQSQHELHSSSSSVSDNASWSSEAILRLLLRREYSSLAREAEPCGESYLTADAFSLELRHLSPETTAPSAILQDKPSSATLLVEDGSHRVIRLVNKDRNVGHILTATMWSRALELFYKSNDEIRRVTAPYVLRLTLDHSRRSGGAGDGSKETQSPSSVSHDQLVHQVVNTCLAGKIPLGEDLVSDILQTSLREGSWRQGLSLHALIAAEQPNVAKSPSIRRNLEALLANMMRLSDCSGMIATMTKYVRRGSWAAAAQLVHENMSIITSLPVQMVDVANTARFSVLACAAVPVSKRPSSSWVRALELLPVAPHGQAQDDLRLLLRLLSADRQQKLTSRGSAVNQQQQTALTPASTTTTNSELQIGLRRRSKHFLTAFNSDVRVCLHDGNWQGAVELYQRASRHSIAVSAHQVVQLCATNGHWEQSLRVYEDLARRRRPDVQTTLAALGACMAGSRWVGAMRIFRFSIMSQRLPPPLIIHGALTVAAAAGRADVALSACRQLMNSNTNPLVIDAVMECLAAQRLHNEIVEYFYMMVTNGVRPLERTLEIAIVASEAATGECRHLALTVHGIAWALEDLCRVTGAVLDHVMLVQQSSGKTQLTVGLGHF